MLAIIKEDAKILIPNPDHKNFTESDLVIPSGKLVHGTYVAINGLRRGKPFTYKLFKTEDNQLIFKNKTDIMNTEVTLGADATTTPTMVNLLPSEKNNKHKFYGAIAGGILGFIYAKYRKHDLKKSAMYIGVGAALGLGVGYYMDKNKKVQITPSK